MKDSHDKNFHHDNAESVNSSKLEMLKKNLSNLENKVKDLRETRQKKKTDVFEKQKKLNQELSTIVQKHAKGGEIKESEIAPIVKEQVDHQPNSLTKENILLRQENQKLKDELFNKNHEIEKLYLEIKQLKRARDEGLDRIGELSKIIESKQVAEEMVYRKDNQRSLESDKQVREQRVAFDNTGKVVGQKG